MGGRRGTPGPAKKGGIDEQKPVIPEDHGGGGGLCEDDLFPADGPQSAFIFRIEWIAVFGPLAKIVPIAIRAQEEMRDAPLVAK